MGNKTDVTISTKRERDFTATMVSKDNISEFIDRTFSTIKKGDAMVLSVQSNCMYISVKAVGHEHDLPLLRVDNFGFNCGVHTEDLIFAIMDIADELPGYVFKAMSGDIEAMKDTAKWRAKKIKEQLEGLEKHESKYKKLRRALKNELEDIEYILELDGKEFKENFSAITISIVRS